MAGKMTIPIVRDASYEVGDRVEVEIDGQVQPDLVYMFDSVGERQAASGAVVDPLLHETLARFAAGDYSVRLRGVDVVGNDGAWSGAQVIEHRPVPEPPAGLSVNVGVLSGSWRDG